MTMIYLCFQGFESREAPISAPPSVGVAGRQVRVGLAIKCKYLFSTATMCCVYSTVVKGNQMTILRSLSRKIIRMVLQSRIYFRNFSRFGHSGGTKNSKCMFCDREFAGISSTRDHILGRQVLGQNKAGIKACIARNEVDDDRRADLKKARNAQPPRAPSAARPQRVFGSLGDTRRGGAEARSRRFWRLLEARDAGPRLLAPLETLRVSLRTGKRTDSSPLKQLHTWIHQMSVITSMRMSVESG